MAEEDTKIDEGQVEDQTAEGAETADSTEAVTTEPETKTAPEPSEAEKRLSEQVNDLQGKFDTISQDATKSKELLEEIGPFVDWDGMKAGRAGSDQDEDTEGEQTFLTQKEAKDLEKRIDQKIKTNDFIRDFRTRYSDLADKGPKEEVVRFFFEKERAGSFDKRLENAVKATRALLKSEQDKALTQAKDDKEKEEQEARAKAAAAAKASGLSSEGITSPKTTKGEKADTAEDYVASRKAKLEKLRTL